MPDRTSAILSVGVWTNPLERRRNLACETVTLELQQQLKHESLSREQRVKHKLSKLAPSIDGRWVRQLDDRKYGSLTMSTIIETVKAMQSPPPSCRVSSAYSAESEQTDWPSHFRAKRKCWRSRADWYGFIPESD